ncbi:pentapeptide repeat-containing protein [Microcoleus sp.]|uniref:pentapeptide repeat-containing protein n=1 Tax=Microcoleus sp. TaxID=44472 RepID=UPI003526A8A1
MEQEQAQRIFVQLVRPGEGTEDTRRLATRAELGEENWNLVQELAGESARLVVTGRNEATGEETVEVVHEALIREWQSLREWMERDRDFRTWQERLRVVMRQWEATNKKDRALLTGFPLDEAKDWLERRRADMSELERDFIKLSLTLREKEVKERKSQQQRITVARTTAICFGIVGVTLIILLNRQSIITVVITSNKKHLAKSDLLKNFYLPKADLSEANLEKANLSQADLTEANLSRANLQSAYLWKTFIPRANLLGADLSQANLSEADLTEANLSGANLKGANFVKNYMPRSNLLKANLSEANLSEANIDGADLSGADLKGAQLVKTFMPGVQLKDADLSQANLSEAYMDRADLSGANLQGAKNLNPDQVKRAKNWEKAKYDEDFSKKLGLKGSK